MKAIRFYDKGDIRLEDVAVPNVGVNGLLVKVQACAICGTDLKMFLNGNPRVKPPQTIGHEFVGEIVELGRDVKSFSIGDRVTMATSISCGRCSVCEKGYTNRCEKLSCISYDYPGAFAEYLAIPPAGIERGNVVQVPKNLGDIAALAEPVSCAVNSQILAGVKTGDTVVIIGCGPLGAIQAQLAKANGAKKVIVTQRSQSRLKLAKNLDVDEIIDASKFDVVQEIINLTDGIGADVVIVTAPDADAQQQALSMACKGGMINLFASLTKGASELKIDSRLIHYRELFVSGASDSTASHVKMAVELLDKGLINEKAVTHTFGIEHFMEGLEMMRSKCCFKVLIKPE